MVLACTGGSSSGLLLLFLTFSIQIGVLGVGWGGGSGLGKSGRASAYPKAPPSLQEPGRCRDEGVNG